SKKRGANEGEGSRPKVKRRKTSAARQDSSATSGHISSPEPILTIDPTGLATGNPYGDAAETAESWEDRSLHVPPHDSANCSQVEEGESSRNQAYYVPECFVHQRGRVDTPMWCRVIMVHLEPPVAQEESNALNNATALKRGWFNLGRGTLAQTDILERVDLEHNAKLYTDMTERYRSVKGEHDGCGEKFRVLEDQNNELSQVNKDQALRFKELEDILAKEKERLVAQLSQTEMAKFDCIPFQPGYSTGWAKGLTEERFKEDLLDIMSRMENIDAYVNKKMYVEYDKLFEKRYPFREKISHDFRHKVADLLKVYPDPPPSRQAPSTTVGAPTKHSSGKALGSSAPQKP
ncbi:hypothetical protein Tco_1328483, partial [Tanacetum coccineum]